MTDIAESLEERVNDLEQKVDYLLNERPGRRRRPILVSKAGICGLDPECDSATCEPASIYRYQQGCRGDRCVQLNTEYYAEYRAKRAKEKEIPEAVIEADAS